MAKLKQLLKNDPLSLWRPPGTTSLGAITTGWQLQQEDEDQYVLAGIEPRRIHRVEGGQAEPQEVLVEVMVESKVADVFARLTEGGQAWLLRHVAIAIKAAERSLSQHKLVLPIQVPQEVALTEAMNALFAIAIGRDRSADGWPAIEAVEVFLDASIQRALRDYTHGAIAEAQDRAENALALCRDATNQISKLAARSASLRDTQSLVSQAARLQLAKQVAEELCALTLRLESICQ